MLFRSMTEGKALQLSVATYELFQTVKKKPPLAKRDIKRFTGNVQSMTAMADLTKGVTLGSGSVMIHSPDEWKEEKITDLKHANSQAILDSHQLSGSVAYSLLLPNVTN